MVQKGDRGSLTSFFRAEQARGLCALLWTGIYFGNLLYLSRRVKLLTNSDVASELILGRVLGEDGGILSRDWYYSTELRVLNTQIVYKWFLRIFPHNWQAARIGSIAVFLLLLSLAGLYLFRTIEGRITERGILAAAILICPFGQWYAWNVVYASYYVPHIAISVFSLALFFRLLRNRSSRPRRKVYLPAILLALLSFAAGLGGVRQLMLCYVPMLLAAVLILFDQKKDAISFPAAKGVFLWSLVPFLSSVLGCGVNEFILHRYYYFEDQSQTTWLPFSLSRFTEFAGGLFAQFGWQGNVNFLSVQSLSNALCVGISLAIVASGAALFVRRVDLSDTDYYLLLFTMSAFGLLLVLYSHSSKGNNSYWIPLVPFCYFLVLRMLAQLRDQARRVLLTALIVCHLCSAGLSTMADPYPTNPTVPHPDAFVYLSGWLETLGFTQGYASFWEANVLTELSSGEIRLYVVDDYPSLHLYDRLQRISNAETAPAQDFFVLMTLDEWNGFRDKTRELLLPYSIYFDPDYAILALPDLETYQSAFSAP